MKVASILATLVSAGMLFAQEPDRRLQVFGEAARPQSFTVFPAVQDRAGSLQGLGARYLGELASAPGWYYEVGGKLDAASHLKLFNPAPAVNADLRRIAFTDSYWAMGAGYLAPLGGALSLGLHLEGRGEALKIEGAQLDASGNLLGQVRASNTYLRLWGRVTLDTTFRLRGLRAFAGVEGAATPFRTSQTHLVALTNLDPRMVRSMAPGASAAAYLGFHF